MPRDIKALLATAFAATKLNILVFGPQVHTPSPDPRTRHLQDKRQEIRARLESDGHYVRYAEEVADPSLTGPASNAMFQELLIMEEYDFIVTLVESPGSIAEATLISIKPKLAQKAALFLDAAYVGGLVGEVCAAAAEFGAQFQTYDYPVDLTDCHLLTRIVERATTLQKVKYLL